jgi:hypothetical protein
MQPQRGNCVSGVRSQFCVLRFQPLMDSDSSMGVLS